MSVASGVGTAGVSVHIPIDMPRPLVTEGEAHVSLLTPMVSAARSTSKREEEVDEFYLLCRTASTVHTTGSLTGAYTSNSSITLVSAPTHHPCKMEKAIPKGTAHVMSTVGVTSSPTNNTTTFHMAHAGVTADSPPANMSGSFANLGTASPVSVSTSGRGRVVRHIYCKGKAARNTTSSLMMTASAGPLLHVLAMTCVVVNLLTNSNNFNNLYVSSLTSNCD